MTYVISTKTLRVGVLFVTLEKMTFVALQCVKAKDKFVLNRHVISEILISHCQNHKALFVVARNLH